MRSPNHDFDKLIARLEKDIFDQNLARVNNLIAIYRRNGCAPAEDRAKSATDVLRAATVLLHASLEELLRGIAIARISFTDEATLDHVPLAGLNGAGRAEKFLLGRLGAFRGRSVDSVIWESVESHFTTAVTFNSTTDVSVVLRQAGIDTRRMSRFFPVIDAMLRRRHRIVHQADRNNARRYACSGKESPLDVRTLEHWLSTVRRFGYKTLECLCGLRLKEIEDLVMLGDPKADSDLERQLRRRFEENRKTPQHGVTVRREAAPPVNANVGSRKHGKAGT